MKITLYSPGRHRTGLYRQPASRGSLRQRCPPAAALARRTDGNPVTASRRREGREQTHPTSWSSPASRCVTGATRTWPICSKTAGVDFQRGTRSAQYNNFAFQGHISNNKILIMLDGVRIDHPAGGKIRSRKTSASLARQVRCCMARRLPLAGRCFAGVINIITDKRDSPWKNCRRHRQLRRRWKGAISWSAATGRSRFAQRWRPPAGKRPGDLGSYYAKRLPQGQCHTFAGATAIPASQRENYAGGISSNSQFMRPRPYRDDVTVLPQPLSQPGPAPATPPGYGVLRRPNLLGHDARNRSGKYRFHFAVAHWRNCRLTT